MVVHPIIKVFIEEDRQARRVIPKCAKLFWGRPRASRQHRRQHAVAQDNAMEKRGGGMEPDQHK
jgi:hypothetical protein